MYLIVDVLQLLLVGRKMLKLKEKRVHGTERSFKKRHIFILSLENFTPPPFYPCCHGVLLTIPRVNTGQSKDHVL
jgi:hypothetical protein